MNTDFEQDLRQLLGAAEPPSAASPDQAHVLAQGNRALRRQTARRAVTGAAAIAAIAVVATSFWSSGRPSSIDLPAGTPSPSPSPSASATLHFGAGYGDPDGTDYVAGDFDTTTRALRITIARDDPQKIVETMDPIVVPDSVTTPIVQAKKGSGYVVVLVPPDVADVSLSTTPRSAYLGGADPDLDTAATGFQMLFARLESPATSNDPIDSVTWTTPSGERVSSLGDRSTPEVVPLSGERTVRVWILEQAGELAVDGPPDVGFTWMSLKDAEGGLPGIHQGRRAQSESGPTDWFALYLLPEGSTDVTPTYAAGFTPSTPMIVTPLKDGRVVVVFDLGTWVAETSPLKQFTWRDAAGNENTERV